MINPDLMRPLSLPKPPPDAVQGTACRCVCVCVCVCARARVSVIDMCVRERDSRHGPEATFWL